MLNFLRSLFRRDARQPAQYLVTVTDNEIVNRRPDGKTERVRFADLGAIFIETTDRGPFEPDVWWHLVGEQGGACVFPHGTDGEDELLDKIMKLPGFDHAVFAQAMTCADNQRFLCWQRNAAGSAAQAASE